MLHLGRVAAERFNIEPPSIVQMQLDIEKEDQEEKERDSPIERWKRLEKLRPEQVRVSLFACSFSCHSTLQAESMLPRKRTTPGCPVDLPPSEPSCSPKKALSSTEDLQVSLLLQLLFILGHSLSVLTLSALSQACSGACYRAMSSDPIDVAVGSCVSSLCQLNPGAPPFHSLIVRSKFGRYIARDLVGNVGTSAGSDEALCLCEVPIRLVHGRPVVMESSGVWKSLPTFLQSVWGFDSACLPLVSHQTSTSLTAFPPATLPAADSQSSSSETLSVSSSPASAATSLQTRSAFELSSVCAPAPIDSSCHIAQEDSSASEFQDHCSWFFPVLAVAAVVAIVGIILARRSS